MLLCAATAQSFWQLPQSSIERRYAVYPSLQLLLDEGFRAMLFDGFHRLGWPLRKTRWE